MWRDNKTPLRLFVCLLKQAHRLILFEAIYLCGRKNLQTNALKWHFRCGTDEQKWNYIDNSCPKCWGWSAAYILLLPHDDGGYFLLYYYAKIHFPGHNFRPSNIWMAIRHVHLENIDTFKWQIERTHAQCKQQTVNAAQNNIAKMCVDA